MRSIGAYCNEGHGKMTFYAFGRHYLYNSFQEFREDKAMQDQIKEWEARS